MLRNSYTAFFFLDTLKHQARLTLEKDPSEDRFQHIDAMFGLPESWPLEKRKQHFMTRYADYVRSMQRIANDNQIKFALFIQPVMAVGKPLTPEEQQHMIVPGFAENYRQMEQALLSLNTGDNTSIVSLTDIYADYEQTAYTDPIHIAPRSEAMEILIREIINNLARQWQLEPKARSNR